MKIKEKIFEKMREYGWNLNYNTNKDFEEIYNIHYNRINNKWGILENKTDITENEELELEDLRFITDFLRAINDIDDTISTK